MKAAKGRYVGGGVAYGYIYIHVYVYPYAIQI